MSIKVERDKDMLKITFPFSPEFVQRIKTIPGRYWHQQGKFWTVPDTNDILKLKVTFYFYWKKILYHTLTRQSVL